MRSYVIAVVVVETMLSASPRGPEPGNEADVTVYVAGGNLLPGFEDHAFRSVVDGMFSRAGVSIAWVNGNPKTSSGGSSAMIVHLQFVRLSTNTSSMAALAFTSPFAQGVRKITILYDRIRLITCDREREPLVLAHVVAHELAHVLQGTNWHSAKGVMKARWDYSDLVAMEKRQLEFTETDLDLIRDGLNQLKGQAASVYHDTRHLIEPW